MTVYRRTVCTPPSSLATQIAEAEGRLQHRRRMVQIRAAALGQNFRQRMTAPSTLIWAGVVGFLIGELTHRRTPSAPGTDPS